MAYIFAAARALVALGWLIPAATTTAHENDVPRYTEPKVNRVQVAATNDDILKALEGLQKRIDEQALRQQKLEERLQRQESLGITRSIPAPEGKAVNPPPSNMKKVRGWQLTYYDQHNAEKPELARDSHPTSLFNISVISKHKLAIGKLPGIKFEGKLVITETGRHSFRYGYFPKANLVFPSCNGWLKFNGKIHRFDPSNYGYKTFAEDLEPGVYDVAFDLACDVTAVVDNAVTFSVQYLRPNALEHESLDSAVVYHEVDAQAVKNRRRL